MDTQKTIEIWKALPSKLDWQGKLLQNWRKCMDQKVTRIEIQIYPITVLAMHLVGSISTLE
jgi:hypothetical protein